MIQQVDETGGHVRSSMDSGLPVDARQSRAISTIRRADPRAGCSSREHARRRRGRGSDSRFELCGRPFGPVNSSEPRPSSLDGGAHLALGYSSWGTYFKAEFGGEKAQAYRVLHAGRVAEALESPNGDSTRVTESQARELAPLLAEPVQS